MSGAARETVLHVAGPMPYDVVVGHGVAGRLTGLLGDRPSRVALVVPETLRDLAAPVREALADAPPETIGNP